MAAPRPEGRFEQCPKSSTENCCGQSVLDESTRSRGVRGVRSRLLVTASYFETVMAVMSQSNWWLRTVAAYLTRGAVAQGSHARVDSFSRAKQRAFLERSDDFDQRVGRLPVQYVS